jgi:hypothetical protein
LTIVKSDGGDITIAVMITNYLTVATSGAWQLQHPRLHCSATNSFVELGVCAVLRCILVLCVMQVKCT